MSESTPHSSDEDSSGETSSGLILNTTKDQGYKPPRLFNEILPTGGVIRRRWEDFRVEEIPLYTPCGSGEHLYITIEKGYSYLFMRMALSFAVRQEMMDVL